MAASKLGRLIVVLSIVIISFFFLRKESLLYLYKPHSLSEKKASVLIDIIKLFRGSNVLQFGVYSSGGVSLNKHVLLTAVDSEKDLLDRNFGPDVQRKLEALPSVLGSVDITYAEKHNTNYLFFVFYKPLMPAADGILYVDSDADPNNDTDEYIAKYKPYLKITDHWYHSSKLIIVRKEDDLIREIWPKALIDKSNSISDKILSLLNSL